MSNNGTRALPEGWRWAKLGEVCIQDRQVIEPRLPRALSLSYLSLEHIESHTGRILRKPTEAIEDEGQSTTFAFDERHVLYGKLRPYLNKVALPDFAGRCTTEAIPLLPTESDRIFLAWILRRQETVAATMRDKTGSRMPRADMDELLALSIPLPPLTEQRRIAAVLTEHMAAVARARAAAEARRAAARALPAALLRAVFEGEEAQRWERRQLEDICTITARQVDPKMLEYRTLPHVNGENIESATCRLLFLHSAEEDGMTSGKYLFEPGDVLYSKLRPYLRKVVVVEMQGLCSADMYPIKVNQEYLDPHFLGWLLVSDEFTTYADEESRRARMPKINREQLFAWYAPLPSLQEQRHIVATLNVHFAATERARAAAEAQIAAIDALPAALLRKAFNGEL